MTARAFAVLLTAITGLGLAACAELQPVEADRCGNLIIEEGEICDGDDSLGRCRPPGDVDACQYDCRTQAWPPGLLCGARDICWPPNQCGNGVVEPDADEDCDGPSQPFVCRDSEQAGACRYDCTVAACPPGYKCLEGGICDDVDVCAAFHNVGAEHLGGLRLFSTQLGISLSLFMLGRTSLPARLRLRTRRRLPPAVGHLCADGRGFWRHRGRPRR